MKVMSIYIMDFFLKKNNSTSTRFPFTIAEKKNTHLIEWKHKKAQNLQIKQHDKLCDVGIYYVYPWNEETLCT